MPEHARFADEEVRYPAGVSGEGLHQPTIGCGVGSEAGGRLFDRALQHRRRAVVERVGERGRGVDPFQAVIFERQRAEERRGVTQRVYRRTEVVDETWKRDLGRSHASADGASAFEHGNTVPITGKLY